MEVFVHKMRGRCLRWFGYIQKRAANSPVKNNELIQVEGTKNVRVRQKITVIEHRSNSK
jgi:hypothetical protein